MCLHQQMEGLDGKVEATIDDIHGGKGVVDTINGKEEVVMATINEVETLVEVEIKEDEKEDNGGRKYNLATTMEVNITSTFIGASTLSIATVVALSLSSMT